MIPWPHFFYHGGDHGPPLCAPMLIEETFCHIEEIFGLSKKNVCKSKINFVVVNKIVFF